MPKSALNTEGRNAARQAALDDAANSAAGGGVVDDEEELDTGTGGATGDGDEGGEDESTSGQSTRERRQAEVDEEIDKAGEAAEEAAVLDELESKSEITADDLRRLPGSEGLSDEELVALWEKTEKGGTAVEPVKLEGFKLYDSKGAEITDPSQVSALDLLTGNVQIGYNALNKEHRKALRDLTRVASLGHLNERNMTQRTGERDSALSQLRKSSQRVAELEQYQKLWTYAMTAYGQGNDGPMKQLLDTYNKALLAGPGTSPAAGGGSPEENAQGQRLYYETIVPRAREIATKYKVDERDVAETIAALIDREPPEFLDWAKIEQIMSDEVPRLIEDWLAEQGNAAPSEVEVLRKELGEVKAQLANKTVDAVRNKRRNAPVGGGGRRRSSENTGDEIVPSGIKTREQAKEWLRS